MNDKITIFGDIHGNLPALEAVFADMDSADLKIYIVWVIWLVTAHFPMRSFT